MLLFLVALAVAEIQPPGAKADDAVAAFEQLCTGVFLGGESAIDPSRFTVTKLDPATAKQIKPDFGNATIWDVSGNTSQVHMLVHYEPTGMCVVEVAEADEGEIREKYIALVDRSASTLKIKPEHQADRINEVEGKPATTSMWRLKGQKRDIMFAITTYPEAKFMIQHVLTVSYVR
jgi:hypothetical protein